MTSQTNFTTYFSNKFCVQINFSNRVVLNIAHQNTMLLVLINEVADALGKIELSFFANSIFVSLTTRANLLDKLVVKLVENDKTIIC
jgi:hypothetical protein